MKKSMIMLSLALMTNLHEHTIASAQGHIDPLYTTTTIVFGLQGAEERSRSSGFFYTHTNGKLYLVVNKHILYGENADDSSTLKIDRLKLILHTDSKNLKRNEDYIISLVEGKGKAWFELSSNPEADVVLVPLRIEEEKYHFYPLIRGIIELLPRVEIGFEKILVIGFPQGLYDDINNLPIMVTGQLASPFKVPYRGKKVMLGQADVYQGMSGSPVLMKLEDYVVIHNKKRRVAKGSARTVLVGIYSDQPLRESADEKEEILQPEDDAMINIWSSDLILDIIEEHR